MWQMCVFALHYIETDINIRAFKQGLYLLSLSYILYIKSFLYIDKYEVYCVCFCRTF